MDRQYPAGIAMDDRSRGSGVMRLPCSNGAIVEGHIAGKSFLDGRFISVTARGVVREDGKFVVVHGTEPLRLIERLERSGKKVIESGDMKAFWK